MKKKVSKAKKPVVAGKNTKKNAKTSVAAKPAAKKAAKPVVAAVKKKAAPVVAKKAVAAKPPAVAAKVAKPAATKAVEKTQVAAKPAKVASTSAVAKKGKPEEASKKPAVAVKATPSKGPETKKKVQEEELFVDDIGEFDDFSGAGDEIIPEIRDVAPLMVGGDEGDPDDIVLTDAEGRRYCKIKDCDQLSSVEGYCRYHYLLMWKRIQMRKKILAGGKLDKYIDDLTSRYPDKYIEMIRKDLKTEKDFLSAIQEMEIDDSAASDAEGEEDAQTFIDEVRGMGAATSGRSGRDDDEF